jgi:hypothetical protein
MHSDKLHFHNEQYRNNSGKIIMFFPSNLCDVSTYLPFLTEPGFIMPIVKFATNVTFYKRKNCIAIIPDIFGPNSWFRVFRSIWLVNKLSSLVQPESSLVLLRSLQLVFGSCSELPESCAPIRTSRQ